MATSNDLDKKPQFSRMCFVQDNSTKWPALLFSSHHMLVNSLPHESVRSKIFVEYLKNPQGKAEAVALLFGTPRVNHTVVVENIKRDTSDFIDTYFNYTKTDIQDEDLKKALELAIFSYQRSVESENKVKKFSIGSDSNSQPRLADLTDPTPPPVAAKKPPVSKSKDEMTTALAVETPLSSKSTDAMSTESTENEYGINRYDTFKEAWKKMEEKGWKCKTAKEPGMLYSEYVYYAPWARENKFEGRDYFAHQKSIISYMRKTFHWDGASEPSPLMASGTRQRKGASRSLDISEVNAPKKRLATSGKQSRNEKRKARSASPQQKKKKVALSPIIKPVSKQQPTTTYSPVINTQKSVSVVSNVEHASIQMNCDSSLESATEVMVHDDIEPITQAFNDVSSIDSGTCPTFEKVWNILSSELGFWKHNHLFVLPGISSDKLNEKTNAFTNETELRKYLLKNKIPGSKKSIKQGQFAILKHWLCQTNVPRESRDLPPIKDNHIWTKLKKRGFKYQHTKLHGAVYTLPDFELPKPDVFDQLEGVYWVRQSTDFQPILCRNGVPGDDDDDKYQLSVWAGQCDLEIFDEDDKSVGSRERRRLSRDGSHKRGRPKKNKHTDELRRSDEDDKSVGPRELRSLDRGSPKKKKQAAELCRSDEDGKSVGSLGSHKPGRPKQTKQTVETPGASSVISDLSSVTHTVATGKSSKVVTVLSDKLNELEETGVNEKFSLEQKIEGATNDDMLLDPKEITSGEKTPTRAKIEKTKSNDKLPEFGETTAQEEASDNVLLEPEDIYTNRRAWGKLQKKLSFKFCNNQYVLPNVDPDGMEPNENEFASLPALRSYLVKNQIPADPSKLDEVETMGLSRWLAYTHVPENAPAMGALSDKEAFKMLKKRGYDHKSGYYLTPGVAFPRNEIQRQANLNKGYFEKMEHLQEWCCKHGIEGEQDNEKIQLALWASSCLLNIFTSREVRRDRHRHRRSSSSSSASFSTPSKTPRKRNSSSMNSHKTPLKTVVEKEQSTENSVNQSGGEESTSKTSDLEIDEEVPAETHLSSTRQIFSQSPETESNQLITQPEKDLNSDVDVNSVPEEANDEDGNEPEEDVQALIKDQDTMYGEGKIGENHTFNDNDESTDSNVQMKDDINEKYISDDNHTDAGESELSKQQGKVVDEKDPSIIEKKIPQSNNYFDGENSVSSETISIPSRKFSSDMSIFSMDGEQILEKEYLDSCLTRLHLTFDNNVDKTLLTRPQTEKTKQFLQRAATLRGFTSDGCNATDKRILHICGAPGTGKTSAVRANIFEIKWLENKLHQGSPARGNDRAIEDSCFKIVNCSHLQATTKYDEHFARLISDAMGLTKVPSLGNIEKKLNSSNSNFYGMTVILVLDEVDLLKVDTGSSKVLEQLFTWSLSSNHAFNIVCISNVVDIQWVSKFSHIPGFKESLQKIVFPPYQKEELIKIVEQRVGKQLFERAALQLAGRKIASASGDARAMLNLVSNAIQNYRETFDTANEYNKISPSSMRPLINLKNVFKAIRETVGKTHAERIGSLPVVAQTVLCVAVTLGHCLGNQSPIRQRKLRWYCEAASQNGVLENLSMEHFSEVLDLLINSGLLIVRGDDLFHGESQERVFHLGVQLDDVECALEKTLFKKGFFQRMRVNVRDEFDKNHESFL